MSNTDWLKVAKYFMQTKDNFIFIHAHTFTLKLKCECCALKLNLELLCLKEIKKIYLEGLGTKEKIEIFAFGDFIIMHVPLIILGCE